jgi:NTE family protein
MKAIKRRFKPSGVTLCLGAGAARGFAHIGVLRALHKENIPIDQVIGVSIGSLVGSIYCMSQDPEFVKKRLHEFTESEVFLDSLLGSWSKVADDKPSGLLDKINRAYSRTGMISRIALTQGIINIQEMTEIFYPFIAPLKLETLRKPFAAVAVDIMSGNSVIFTHGDLRKVVMASSSIPLVFPPITIGERLFSDGSILDKLGLDAAITLGLNRIIAVDISDSEWVKKEPGNALDLMIRTEEIAAKYRKEKQLNNALITIKPVVGHMHWADYSKAEELVQSGYEITMSMMKEIKDSLKISSGWRRYFYASNTFSKPPIVPEIF